MIIRFDHKVGGFSKKPYCYRRLMTPKRIIKTDEACLRALPDESRSVFGTTIATGINEPQKATQTGKQTSSQTSSQNLHLPMYPDTFRDTRQVIRGMKVISEEFITFISFR